MLSLCRIDAAFRRLYEYDPDFDVSLLSVDESDLTEEDRTEYLAKVRIIRITLVARIADIGMYIEHNLPSQDMRAHTSAI